MPRYETDSETDFALDFLRAPIRRGQAVFPDGGARIRRIRRGVPTRRPREASTARQSRSTGAPMSKDAVTRPWWIRAATTPCSAMWTTISAAC